MAQTIALIITYAILMGILLYKLFPYFIELGKLRNEREQNTVPEIKFLRRENEILLRDIERIIEGDKYIEGIWKERIEQRKSFKLSLGDFAKL